MHQLRNLVVLAMLLAACNPTSGDLGSGRIKVVVTNTILAELVQKVAGERVELVSLVGRGQDAHAFEPSPADAVALAEAGLVFENGLGFEPWLDGLYVSSGSKATRVEVTAGIEPLRAGGHEQGAFDPHVWHDVTLMTVMVENVRDALATADPANAEVYKTSAGGYRELLDGLDKSIVAKVDTLPHEHRKLVTSHDTFAYFARRYGFEIVGTALGAATTDGADPSAGEIAALVEAIKATGVPAIFAENVTNPGLMEQIAAEAGVRLAEPLYTDALSPLGTRGDSYLAMMSTNVTIIVTALKP